MARDDPQTWHLDVRSDCIDLYHELRETPRRLDVSEAEMMVELVDAWRALEHRKHAALEACLADQDDAGRAA
jgi:hypothetical protein